MTVLVVEVEGHRCGLAVESVVEVHRMVACAPLPDAPAIVDGLIDVRGTVVAVLDLHSRFGLTRRPPAPSDHMVLLRLEDRVAALRVDRILELVTVPIGAIDEAKEFPAAAHLDGVARLDGGLLLIHDVGAFLSGDEMAALDDAIAVLEASGSER